MSGTLSGRLPALRGKVEGKTGTTDLACTLSGLIRRHRRVRGARERQSGLVLDSPRRAGSVRHDPRVDASSARRPSQQRASRSGRAAARDRPRRESGHPASRPSPPSTPGSRRRSPRSCFLETESMTFAPSSSSAAFAWSRLYPSSVPVITYRWPVSGPSTGLSDSPTSNCSPSPRRSSTSARFSSSENHSAISSARSGPIPSASSSSSWVAAISAVNGPEMPGEIAREHPTHLRHVEAEEHARERLRLRPLDGIDRSGGRDLAVALDLEELLGRQPVQIGHRAKQPFVPELADELLADSLDVHRCADPVDQGLEPTRGAGAVRAAVLHLALGLDDLDATERTVRRHLPGHRAGPVLSRRADDLRDHIAGPLNDHEITFTDVLAVDVLLVVQRCGRYGHAADLRPARARPRG